MKRSVSLEETQTFSDDDWRYFDVLFLYHRGLTGSLTTPQLRFASASWRIWMVADVLTCIWTSGAVIGWQTGPVDPSFKRRDLSFYYRGIKVLSLPEKTWTWDSRPSGLPLKAAWEAPQSPALSALLSPCWQHNWVGPAWKKQQHPGHKWTHKTGQFGGTHWNITYEYVTTGRHTVGAARVTLMGGHSCPPTRCSTFLVQNI